MNPELHRSVHGPLFKEVGPPFSSGNQCQFLCCTQGKTSALRQRPEAVKVGACRGKNLGLEVAGYSAHLLCTSASQESHIHSGESLFGNQLFLYCVSLQILACEHSFERPPALKIQVSPETPALLLLVIYTQKYLTFR